MTIVASVKVRDGLILGTDSMTQISAPTEDGGAQILKSYANARKLFQVGDAIGVMTYGLGNIGSRSIEGLVLDVAKEGDVDKGSVEAVARALHAQVGAVYDEAFGAIEPEHRPVLGFYIAGYSAAEPFAHEYEFLLPRDESPFAAREPGEFGASWRGVDSVFTRLYKGFDAYVLPPRLEAAGLTEEQIVRVFDPSDGLETQVLFDGMPVQDAVNFGVYILDTTIGWSTFQLGAPLCGGPLQIAAILPMTGFEWISKPHLTVHG